jgi:hypothetical protein
MQYLQRRRAMSGPVSTGGPDDAIRERRLDSGSSADARHLCDCCLAQHGSVAVMTGKARLSEVAPRAFRPIQPLLVARSAPVLWTRFAGVAPLGPNPCSC